MGPSDEVTPEAFLSNEEVKQAISPGKIAEWRKTAVRLTGSLAMAFLKEAYNQIVYGQAYIDSKKR